VKKLLAFTLITIAFAFFLGTQNASAYETTCPEGMTDNECLEYLQQQAQLVQGDKSALENQLNQEKFEQLNLTQQINYLNEQISARQSLISEMELEIETKNVQIRIIAKDIEEIQEEIDILTQEVNTLKDSLAKRATISYKYTKITPLEVFFSADNLDTFVRKTKYITEARKKDRETLNEYTAKMDYLEKQEEEMVSKRLEIQLTRNEIESQKSTLYTEKATFDEQSAQVAELIAESQRREAEYNAQIAELSSFQNSLDSQITELIMSLFHEGQLGDGTPVYQGQIIGFQGHTGCSYGSHLHYGVATTGSYQWGTNVNPFDGHVGLDGNFVVNGAGNAPLDSGYITQWFHQGHYLDIVSLSAGNQLQNSYGSCWSSPSENQCYFVPAGTYLCAQYTSYDMWLPLQGEGAPVYSLYSGVVYYGVDSWGGAKYALVDHQNGYFSMYVHLR